MKHILRSFSLAMLAFVASLSAVRGEDEKGFTPLFDGKTLSGWKKVNGNGEFVAEDGCIVGKGKNVSRNTFLRTEKTYKDFDFRFQMKFDSLEGNSGCMFRGLQKAGENGQVFGYQCEHDNGKERAWTAGLYDEARRGWLMPDKKNAEESKKFTLAGQKIMRWEDWNDVRIVCKGNEIKIWLNGELRVEYTDQAPESTLEGFFGFQVHAGKSCLVRWKNIRIKEL